MKPEFSKLEISECTYVQSFVDGNNKVVCIEILHPVFQGKARGFYRSKSNPKIWVHFVASDFAFVVDGDLGKLINK